MFVVVFSGVFGGVWCFLWVFYCFVLGGMEAGWNFGPRRLTFALGGRIGVGGGVLGVNLSMCDVS